MKPKKPAKPYRDFPLYPHAAGQWAKRILGRVRYFGSWKAGWEEALRNYEAQRERLYTGREPAQEAPEGGVCVKDAVNYFLKIKQDARDAGEIAEKTYREYEAAGVVVLDVLGRATAVEGLRPDDFARLKRNLAERLGPVRMGNEITRIRAIFKHALDDGLVAAVRFGREFKRPSRQTIRLANAGKKRDFTAAEVADALAIAKGCIRAMVLLGRNCGMGNRDCGLLEFKHLDLAGGWMDFPRPKTGIARRAKLWPETVKAFRQVAKKRTAGQVFVTKYGGTWTPDSHTPISGEFRKLCIDAGIHLVGRGFYGLRHTFETVAGQCADQVAIDHVMGHVSEHISANYRHSIADARLENVAETVRTWLLAETNRRSRRRSRPRSTTKTPVSPRSSVDRAAVS